MQNAHAVQRLLRGREAVRLVARKGQGAIRVLVLLESATVPISHRQYRCIGRVLPDNDLAPVWLLVASEKPFAASLTIDQASGALGAYES